MPIRMPELITKKRNGKSLSEAEIRQVISGYTNGIIPDYQMSALLMAIFFKGLTPTELTVLTDAMCRSGEVMDHRGLPGRKVDKHSTGGVGDKISIPLAPAVAALGVKVPMISGRGLGYTGGTLDKLESIPGFKVHLSNQEAGRLLERLNLFLIGQTDQVAVADKKMYALRDVTGTVESIPLISSSIMSKKLAEGIDGLVLDVKFGSGAFMTNLESATELATTLIGIGRAAGKRVHALLTDMNSPIGRAVGNALEMRESIEVLKGGGPADTRALTVALGAHMLVLGERAQTVAEGANLMEEVLNDGRALSRFAEIIEAQGGDSAVIDHPDKLPRSREQVVVQSPCAGVVEGINPMMVANAALRVGAGRVRKEDDIDPATGVMLEVQVGDEVTKGAPLAVLHHNGSGQEEALALLEQAFRIGDEPMAASERIVSRLVD